jgi:excinuclease ABC subunit B
MDNRPLTFPEFESKLDQVIAVSATPSDFEIMKSSTNENLPVNAGR